MTGIGWLDTLLATLGPTVLIASLVASGLNAVVRSAQEKGLKVPGWALAIQALVNFLASNGDKVAQAVKGGRGPSLPSGSLKP